ncbi:alpha/beta hydrolase [Penaeicola halotolerans]|uniref:alpha/beta hydrolase n=1 Tax=Penaeicola halotolerans TaxID=2793196 RepID=UPI001CF8D504|nr:alpha/beta hydrolase [Penaeicola halotolerans]
MKKFLRIVGILVVILGLIYLAGPKSKVVQLDGTISDLSLEIDQVDEFLAQKESATIGVKPDNQARVIWYDSTPSKTKYSIVYLHGFGASWAEGEPVHRQIAEKFGANLLLARLDEHGIDRENSFENLSAQSLVDSAKEAVALGQVLGDSVIVMGTSTGGALATYLAAENPSITAVISYSPIIAAYEDRLDFFFKPWMKQLAIMSRGEMLDMSRSDSLEQRYWSTRYHVNGYEALAVFVKSTMTPETFQKIEQPYFLGYYYKNEEEQDKVVSVAAMLEMFEVLASSTKEKEAFPTSGNHVIASFIRSQDYETVYQSTEAFLIEKVGLKPIK